MGVSFRIAKVRSRYRTKALPQAPPDPAAAEDAADGRAAKRSDREVNLVELGPEFADHSVTSANCEDLQASFSLNLFPNGFSVGKPTEGMLLPLLEDTPELLHPYDRESMTLFSAIEYGRLPGDIFDDIPCKYFNGAVICEVWDYRSSLSKLGDNDSSGDEFPKVQKACLRMGMENVVKDLPSILDASWSYNDILEVESRITKALQPELFLSPDPSLNRLCRPPFKKQLDLGMSKGTSMRKQHDVPEINLDPADITHARDISRNGCCDSLKPQPLGGTCSSDLHAILRGMPNVQQNDIIMTHVSDHTLPVAFGTNYNSILHCSSSAANVVAVNSNSVLAPDQSIEGSSNRLKDFTFLSEKRDRCEYQLVHEPSPKRLKKGTPLPNYFQYSSSQRDILFEKELQKNITPLEKQIGFQGMLQSRICDVSYPQSEMNGTVLGGIPKLEAQMPSLAQQGGPQYSVKETLPGIKILPKVEVEVDKKNHALEVASDKSNQLQPLSFKSSLARERQGNSTGPSLEKGTKNSGTSRKRKSTQGPLVSARDSVRSPVSNLGENHRIPTRASYSTCTEVTDIRCHVDKAAQVPSASVVNASAGSDVIHSLPRNTKKISKSHIRVTSLNKGCSGSSATVSDSSLQFCSKGFFTGTTDVLPLSGGSGDPSTLERLSKIVRVATRHGLSNEKNRVGESLTGKPICHFPFAHMTSLLTPENFEECTPLMDKMCISKLLIGGNRNICKTRIMTFVRVRYVLQENSCPLAFFDSWKLILFESEKPEDHEVGAELIFGQEGSIHIAQFPSPHHADLFADQFISLMEREGYKLKNDEIRPTRTSFADASSGNSLHIGSSSDTYLPCDAPDTVQSLRQVGNLGSRNSILNPPHLFSPQKVRTPITDPTCFNSTGPNQYDTFACQSSMQQHHSHNQRSMLSLQDTLGNSQIQMGGQLPNSSISPYSVQFQQHLLKQHQQQKVLLSEMHSLGAIGNEMGMGEHLSALAVSQTGDNLQQMSGFSQPGVQSLNGGNSPDQARWRSKPRQASIQHTGVMDGIPINKLTTGIFRITRDGSFMGRAHQSCHVGQSHDPDNIWIGPSNAPLGHVDSKRHEHLKQMRTQLEEEKPHHPLYWQQQELVSSPLQVVSPIVTQMSQSTPGSPRELNSGSAPHLVNASIANKHSPHLRS